MTWSEVTVLVAGLLLVGLWLVWVIASRLDRLHRKVGSSRAVLDNQLVRRASAAAELAASGLLDPASSVLVGEAAWAALVAGSETQDVPLDGLDPEVPLGDTHLDRDMAESELSATVREVLAEPEAVAALRAEPYGAELLEALAASWYRVQLARRFHNEAVAQARRVRRKAVVRVLRLPGHAAMPAGVEIDDAAPPTLGAGR